MDAFLFSLFLSRLLSLPLVVSSRDRTRLSVVYGT